MPLTASLVFPQNPSSDEIVLGDNGLPRLRHHDLESLQLDYIQPFDYASPATALTFSNLGPLFA